MEGRGERKKRGTRRQEREGGREKRREKEKERWRKGEDSAVSMHLKIITIIFRQSGMGEESAKSYRIAQETKWMENYRARENASKG